DPLLAADALAQPACRVGAGTDGLARRRGQVKGLMGRQADQAGVEEGGGGRGDGAHGLRHIRYALATWSASSAKEPSATSVWASARASLRTATRAHSPAAPVMTCGASSG